MTNLEYFYFSNKCHNCLARQPVFDDNYDGFENNNECDKCLCIGCGRFWLAGMFMASIGPILCFDIITLPFRVGKYFYRKWRISRNSI